MSRILVSHVDDGGFRGSLLASLAGHCLIVLLLLLGVELFEPETIELGGPAGGSGSAVSVGLVGELKSGGAGMVKPALEAKPEAFAPPTEKKAEPERKPDEPVFEQAKPEVKPEPKDWHKKAPPPKDPPKPAPAGVIPTRPEPGSGGTPGGALGGSAEGAGTGTGGVSVGTGDGAGGIDSWYVRQVEKRIGGNWLKTSLGELQAPVRTRISFEIAGDGRIQGVQVEESSGISSVDLAAQRAVLASNPLPAPPFEMRRRRIKFVAYFEYPPR